MFSSGRLSKAENGGEGLGADTWCREKGERLRVRSGGRCGGVLKEAADSLEGDAIMEALSKRIDLTSLALLSMIWNMELA